MIYSEQSINFNMNEPGYLWEDFPQFQPFSLVHCSRLKLQGIIQLYSHLLVSVAWLSTYYTVSRKVEKMTSLETEWESISYSLQDPDQVT